jgi:hypothetical protein
MRASASASPVGTIIPVLSMFLLPVTSGAVFKSGNRGIIYMDWFVQKRM